MPPKIHLSQSIDNYGFSKPPGEINLSKAYSECHCCTGKQEDKQRHSPTPGTGKQAKERPDNADAGGEHRDQQENKRKRHVTRTEILRCQEIREEGQAAQHAAVKTPDTPENKKTCIETREDKRACYLSGFIRLARNTNAQEQHQRLQQADEDQGHKKKIAHWQIPRTIRRIQHIERTPPLP